MPIRIIRNRDELEHEIVTSYTQGCSIRSIARNFNMGRNTVRRILRRHETKREHGSDKIDSLKKKIVRISKLDPFLDKIKDLFEKYPDITGVRM